ncbi:MAG TPA: hypothetical protein VII75_09340 [Thermoanaerobaculia bacterium]|nr:hypothetical protein [Thermoanaerobaculia bacterium]
MIDCTKFRASYEPETENPEVLEHVRACDACLDYAVSIDPDVMFRAIGGDELVPPGGIDAFVGDVMREVRLRSTEKSATPRVVAWPRRLAVAATLVAGITGGALVWQRGRVAAPLAPQTPVHNIARVITTKPVIEKYDSDSATIVEMPTGSANDAQIVMIIDEKLPADL